jgi:hypothetical protein
MCNILKGYRPNSVFVDTLFKRIGGTHVLRVQLEGCFSSIDCLTYHGRS